MPKRTSGKRGSEEETRASETQGAARAPEPDPLSDVKRCTRCRIIMRSSEKFSMCEACRKKFNDDPTITAVPSVPKVDLVAHYNDPLSRERRLYALGVSGLPLDLRFFDEFKDPAELASLSFLIMIRRLIAILCDPMTEIKDFLAAGRLVASIVRNDLAADDDATGERPLPSMHAPSGAEAAFRSVERIRELQKESA